MLGGREDSSEFLKKSWFSPSLQNIKTLQTMCFLDFFLVASFQWAHLLQKKLYFLNVFWKKVPESEHKIAILPIFGVKYLRTYQTLRNVLVTVRKIELSTFRNFWAFGRIYLRSWIKSIWTLFSIFSRPNFNWSS